MKKTLLLVAFLLISQINVYAFQYIDETYTGNSAAQAGDTFDITPNQYGGLVNVGLGGVGTSSIIKRAQQFTVNQPSIVNYLSLNALVIPNVNVNTSPQFIDVNFSIVKGSNAYRPSITSIFVPIPSSQVMANASYTFFTDNSSDTKEYKNLLIPFSPFKTELDNHSDYWIVAEAPFSGTTLKYTTKLVGEVNTPEPATLLLLGSGLAGAIWRRRKIGAKIGKSGDARPNPKSN